MALSPEVAEYIARYGKASDVEAQSSAMPETTNIDYSKVSPEVKAYIEQNSKSTPEQVSSLEYEDREKRMNPLEKAGAKTLRGVQFVGGMLPAAWSAATTTPATEYMIQRMEKKTPEEAAKEAGKAAAIDAAVSLATAGIPIVGGIAKGSAKAAIKAGGKALGKEAIEVGGKALAKEGIEALSKNAVKESGEQVAKTALKAGKAAKAGDLSIAKILSSEAGLQDSTISSIAESPFVRKHIKPMISEEVDTLTNKAARSLSRIKNSMPKIRSKIYKDAGIKDSTKVGAAPAMEGIRDIVLNMKKNQTMFNAPEVVKAEKALVDFTKKVKNGKISFGQLKNYGDNFYNEASKLYRSGDKSGARVWSELGDNITRAKYSLPELGAATPKAAKLFEAEKNINRLFRLDKPMGEINLERKIASRYKDLGNQEFKSQLAGLKKSLSSLSEAKKYAQLVDRVAVAHAAIDISKASKPQIAKDTSSLLGKFGKFLPKTSAETKMVNLKQLIESGGIDPNKLLGSVERSKIPGIIGRYGTGLKARQAIYGKLGALPTATIKSLGQAAQRKYLKEE